jgi:hypothetical protein
MSVSFPPGEALSHHRDCVAFAARCDGESLACRITYEALLSMPGALARDYLATFRAHRPAIELIATSLIQDGRARRGELVVLKVDVGGIRSTQEPRRRSSGTTQL